MRLVQRLLALLLLLVAGQAAAQQPADPASAPGIVAAIERFYGQADAMQAEFVQVSRSAALGGEQRQKGRVAIKRPGKMRWEFTSPTRTLFMTDGQTTWIWSQADNQVIVHKGGAGDGAEVTALLSDLSRLHELFDVTLLPADAGAASHVLSLAPRDGADGGFKRLEMTVGRRSLLLERVVLTDQFDNLTDLTFSHVRLDVRLSDADFSFQVPAGAEVVTPGGY